MFREVREIKSGEKLMNEKKKENEGFRKIKPEGTMTHDEVLDFWKELFRA